MSLIGVKTTRRARKRASAARHAVHLKAGAITRSGRRSTWPQRCTGRMRRRPRASQQPETRSPVTGRSDLAPKPVARRASFSLGGDELPGARQSRSPSSSSSRSCTIRATRPRSSDRSGRRRDETLDGAFRCDTALREQVEVVRPRDGRADRRSPMTAAYRAPNLCDRAPAKRGRRLSSQGRSRRDEWRSPLLNRKRSPRSTRSRLFSALVTRQTFWSSDKRS